MANSEDLEAEEQSSAELADVVGDIDGIPLPPAVKKSLWRSLRRLIGAVTDVGVAWAEAKEDGLRATAEARRIAKIDMAGKIADLIEADPQLTARAVNFLGHEMIREQRMRQRIGAHAVEDLRNDPPKEDSGKIIDEDWLTRFVKEAGTKSNEEMQIMFGKILAGEIRRPGRFSSRSIQTLSMLEGDVAKTFEKLCNTSAVLLCGVMTLAKVSPANNGLSKFGLGFRELNILHEAGLIIADFNAWCDLTALSMARIPFDIGGQLFWIEPSQAADKLQLSKGHGVMFSSAGTELRSIVAKNINEKYTMYLADDFAERNWRLVRVIEMLEGGRMRGRAVIQNI